MRREASTPRPDAVRLVQEEGLSDATDRDVAGQDRPYWREDAAYALSVEEVDALEAVTEDLHAMATAATRRMAHDEEVLRRLGLLPGCWPALRESLHDPEAWSLYGRLDLAYREDGLARLLEYNADTPAGLVDAAVSQWSWLEALHPDLDQWNLLHERLVQTFARHVPAGVPERHPSGLAFVFREYVDLPVLDGHRPVLGTWVVGGHAAGLGVRESTSLVTDAGASFVPHYLDAPRSLPEQVRAWVAQA